MKKIYLFAVIFALITGFATYFFISGLKNNADIMGEEKAEVVIALQDIEKDTVVTPGMFEVIKLPVSSITYGTVISAADIDGFVATEKIHKGEQVMASKLTLIEKDAEGLEYNGEYRLSYHLENGNYAYTIYVAAVEDTVARFVRRGDFINIYFRSSGTTPLLKNVKVLEIGKYSDKKASLQGTEIVEYEYITLLLTEQQVETLVPFGNDPNNSELVITLVPYAEGAEITTLPEKTTVNENGETVTVRRSREPVTNYGMGEIQTTTEATAEAG